MFGWSLSLLSSVALVYVAWRTSSVPWIKQRLTKRTIWISFGVCWALIIAGRTLGHNASFPGSAWLEMTGMPLLAILFLCLISLSVVDLITGFGWWGHACVYRLRGWALLVGLLLSGIAFIQGLREPVVIDYHVPLADLPQERNGLIIVALSDLHLGATSGAAWLKARIAQVNQLQPDLIVLLGDVFEGHGRPETRVIETLRTLKAPMGVWGVDGNHERHSKAISPLDDAGIQMLRNSFAMPIPGLVLAGRSQSGRHNKTDEPVWNMPTNRPKGALVLLAHIPKAVEEAADSGVGLMLSGHTHGGQIWPFGYIVKMEYPFIAGKRQKKGMTLLVNRGTGTWGPRMRLWQRSEISRITLYRQKFTAKEIGG